MDTIKFGSLEEELDHIICKRKDLLLALDFYNKHGPNIDINYKSPSLASFSFIGTVYFSVAVVENMDSFSRAKGLVLFRKLLARKDYTGDDVDQLRLSDNDLVRPLGEWKDVVGRMNIMLYRDPRFDVNRLVHGKTILDTFMWYGWGLDLKALLASDRVLDYNKNLYTKEHLSEFNASISHILLSQYLSSRKRIAHWCRLSFDLPEAKAASLFAIIIYLCDGFLRLPPEARSKTGRFLSIASRLPLELQMMLCNRAYGLAKSSIVHQDSEPAFAFYGSSPFENFFH